MKLRPRIQQRMRLLTFLYDTADALALHSRCKRYQVGCVLAQPDARIIAGLGFNGPPCGVSNDRCNVDADPCGCTHAEINAIANMRGSGCKTLIAFVTRHPCWRCASALIATRQISTVICPCDWTINTQGKGFNDLSEAGISVLNVIYIREAAENKNNLIQKMMDDDYALMTRLMP